MSSPHQATRRRHHQAREKVVRQRHALTPEWAPDEEQAQQERDEDRVDGQIEQEGLEG